MRSDTCSPNKKLSIYVGVDSSSGNNGELETILSELCSELQALNIDLKYTFGPSLSTTSYRKNTIFNSIHSSNVAIMDISSNDENVLIEAGYALGCKKSFLILLKHNNSSVEVPSILNFLPYSEYISGDNNTIIKNLKRCLLEYLETHHKSDYYFKCLWGLGEKDYIKVICSELKKQPGDPKEMIYFSRYGDVDAFLEVIVTMHRLYPKSKISFMSAKETLREDGRGHECKNNLILIGGPDFNPIAKKFDKYCPFKYIYEGPKNDEISLKLETSNDIFVPEFTESDEGVQIVDYGFFLKTDRPGNIGKLILIGGAYTHGVLGSILAFSQWDDDKDKPSYYNCKKIVDMYGDNPNFWALVKVEATISKNHRAPLNINIIKTGELP